MTLRLKRKFISRSSVSRRWVGRLLQSNGLGSSMGHCDALCPHNAHISFARASSVLFLQAWIAPHSSPATQFHRPVHFQFQSQRSCGRWSGLIFEQPGENGTAELLGTKCASRQQELPRFFDWKRQYAAKGLRVIATSIDDDPKPGR